MKRCICFQRGFRFPPTIFVVIPKYTRRFQSVVSRPCKYLPIFTWRSTIGPRSAAMKTRNNNNSRGLCQVDVPVRTQNHTNVESSLCIHLLQQRQIAMLPNWPIHFAKTSTSLLLSNCSYQLLFSAKLLSTGLTKR